jgi:hypothetical protein
MGMALPRYAIDRATQPLWGAEAEEHDVRRTPQTAEGAPVKFLRNAAPGRTYRRRLIELNTYALLFAPDDMAWPLKMVARYKKCKSLGDEKRARNFKRRARL